MGLIQRQIDKVTQETVTRAFREGRQPSLGQIAEALKNTVSAAPGAPVMQVRNQKRKRVFNIEAFNQTMEEIAFDLNIAYEELVSIVSAALRRLNLSEVSYKSQSCQLEEVIGVLDNLLFSISNADDNFFGVFDNFESLNKVNLTNTTPGVVDLAERAVQLPANNLTGTKIRMGHLYNKVSWPVSVTTDANVIRNSVGAGAGFGNAFSDVSNVWRQDVIIDQNVSTSIEFDIPISSVEEQEISLNRIQIIPHSTTPMTLEIFYSTDNINFLKLRTSNSKLTLDRQAKTYNFDFSTTRVEQVRIRATKTSPDSQDPDGTFRFSFGFAHLGFYALGRQFQSELQSIALKPVGLSRPIDKVSLRTKEDIPQGTKIEYLVALADTDGEPLGDFRSISPLNSASGVAPAVVRFGNASRRSIPITAASGPTVSVETFRAIAFYALPLGIQDGDDVIFSTARLYRGYGGWNRNTKKDRVLRQVKDSYISFNAGDIQRIYAVVTEPAGPEEAFQTFPGGGQSTVLQTALRVTHNIDFNPATMQLVPPANVDVNIDQRPNYAIYRVLRFRSLMTISLEQVVLNGEVPTLLAQANPVVGLTSRPIVQNNTFPVTITYTEGSDYNVVIDAQGRPTGEINRIASGLIGDGDTVQVTYELNPDITHLCDAARDNLIYLETLLDVDEDDRFDVTYRFVPLPSANSIVKNTINVTSRFGDAQQGDVYSEGPDYSIDIQQGTITRIPSGGIGPGSGGDISVYIDFFYRETPVDLETYTTWIYQPNRAPVRISFPPLNLDKVGGERLIINTNQGQSLDVTDLRETPELQFGWHNVLVRSKNPETFLDAAIIKIALLKDDENDYVFVRGGKYFGEIQADRSPMKQVTETFLKTSVIPTNHGSFAINENGQVILNFQPGATEELYLLQARFDPTNTDADAAGFVTGFFPEEFILEYRFRTEQALISDRIIFRALLSRQLGTDGGLTPKLHKYDLKVG